MEGIVGGTNYMQHKEGGLIRRKERKRTMDSFAKLKSFGASEDSLLCIGAVSFLNHNRDIGR